MSDEWPSWVPPMAGSEVAHLLGSLNRMRATFRWKADGLDAAGLRLQLDSSDLSIGGLLKHLARVEDEVATARLDGSATDPMWDDEDGHDPEFRTAHDDDPETLYRLYDAAVVRAQQRVEEAIAEGGLDYATAMRWKDMPPLSLRRLLFDLLEEYGRHTGHADLLREAVDGRTGEDPPMDWAPFGR